MKITESTCDPYNLGAKTWRRIGDGVAKNCMRISKVLGGLSRGKGGNAKLLYEGRQLQLGDRALIALATRGPTPGTPCRSLVDAFLMDL